jgi:hypothetical protein
VIQTSTRAERRRKLRATLKALKSNGRQRKRIRKALRRMKAQPEEV